MLDLHLHTYYSDGTLSPEALVAEAHQVGLDLIALTDHDHLGGIAPAQAAARPLGMTVIPGVEINTNHEDVEVHVLGYFLSPDHPELSESLARQRHGRQERTRRMVALLQGLGVAIAIEDVVGKPELDSTLGRPHVAEALLKAGSVNSVDDAFKRYLGNGKPAHVPQLGMTVAEAISLIRRAGGLPVLAHPGLWGADEARLRWLVDIGLGGIEVFYPSHTSSQTREYQELARHFGLVMTGSSDYHGPTGRTAGRLGKTAVPAEVEASFRALCRERGYLPA